MKRTAAICWPGTRAGESRGVAGPSGRGRSGAGVKANRGLIRSRVAPTAATTAATAVLPRVIQTQVVQTNLHHLSRLRR